KRLSPLRKSAIAKTFTNNVRWQESASSERFPKSLCPRPSAWLRRLELADGRHADKGSNKIPDGCFLPFELAGFEPAGNGPAVDARSVGGLANVQQIIHRGAL